MSDSVIQQIPIDQIRPSRHQARKDFDEDDIKSLAESIQKEGLVQPVSVRKVEDGYELIAGERRLRAVKLLGWPAVSSIVTDVVSEAAASAKGLVENLQRKDLNPMEEAEGFAKQAELDPTYWTHDEIAKVAGRSRSYVTQSLGFLKIPPEVQDYVRRLTLSRSHALEIVRLPKADEQSKASKLIVDGKLSIKETRKLVEGMLAGKPKDDRPKPKASAPTDPLAKVWDQAQKDPDSLRGGLWDVAFGRSKNSLVEVVEGWTLNVCPTGKDAPAALALWLKMITERVSAAAKPADLKRLQKEKKEVKEFKQQIAQSILGHPLPQPVEVPQATLEAMASALNDVSDLEDGEPRIPKTPQEEAELEALTAQGPGAVYAWIYGPQSGMARAMAKLTWPQMQIADPKEGLAKLLEGLRTMAASRAGGVQRP